MGSDGRMEFPNQTDEAVINAKFLAVLRFRFELQLELSHVNLRGERIAISVLVKQGVIKRSSKLHGLLVELASTDNYDFFAFVSFQEKSKIMNHFHLRMCFLKRSVFGQDDVISSW